MNLISTWRDIIRENGDTLAQSIRDMNKKLGKKVKQSHIYEMGSGERAIPPDIQRYILDVVVKDMEIQVFNKGLQMMNHKAFIQMMTPPNRKK